MLLFDWQTPQDRDILTLAVKHGWQGNLYLCHAAYTLLTAENLFSLRWERNRCRQDGLYAIALEDIRQLQGVLKNLKTNSLLLNFQAAVPVTALGKAVNKLAPRLLTETAKAVLSALVRHYVKAGCGIFALTNFFRTDNTARPIPVERSSGVTLDDLVGYDKQKAQLTANTEAFLAGKPANNVLLYGDAGTGKSTSIQGLGLRYGKHGLRIIEVYKHQAGLIPTLFTQLKNRNYRFILFIDDLSFEETELEYKQLKATLEGGTEPLPDNVLLYVTSNRRHLVRENWKDRDDMEHNGDMHRSETMEEKLSLSARFGLQIFYPSPSFAEYQNIVKTLAQKNAAAQKLTMEELHAAAARWEITSGSTSGRTARQFINSLQ